MIHNLAVHSFRNAADMAGNAPTSSAIVQSPTTAAGGDSEFSRKSSQTTPVQMPCSAAISTTLASASHTLLQTLSSLGIMELLRKRKYQNRQDRKQPENS